MMDIAEVANSGWVGWWSFPEVEELVVGWVVAWVVAGRTEVVGVAAGGGYDLGFGREKGIVFELWSGGEKIVKKGSVFQEVYLEGMGAKHKNEVQIDTLRVEALFIHLIILVIST